MTERIREIYRSRGVTPPDGKGIHKEKFHRCVAKCAQRQGGKKVGKVNCNAVCMASIGRAQAVKKSHQRPKSELESVMRG